MEHIEVNSSVFINTAFEGKVVLITGGSRGIGYACAEQFLKCGAKVIITGRNKKALEAVEKGIDSENFKSMTWDVSDIKNMSERVKQAIGMFGKIDILINNAGIDVTTNGERFGGWFDFTEEDFDLVFDTNLKAPVFLSRELIKYWLKNGMSQQHIVNVCSGCAYKPAKYPYGLSKWGLRAYTQGVGREFAKKGIIINGIAPGATLTDIIKDKTGKNVVEAEGIPIGRYTTPNEVAEAILFLASGFADYLVGEVIRFDGGYSYTVLGGE